MALADNAMKKNISLCLALLLPILPALAVDSVPRDVQNFINQREGCDHMRGEIPDQSEKQRIKEMNREIEKLCKGRKSPHF